MRRVRLVIADRRPIVLQGIVSLLGVQPDFEVVACCLDGASCLAAIRSLTPDVVLLEDGFTDVTASDILAVVDDEGLSSRLVFFTATVACGELARAMATGACGAISMDAKPEALVQSLRLEKPGSDLARVGSEANGAASFGDNVQAVLTVNERTIMDLVAEGLSDSEVARVLGVSLEIVRIHIDHARQKLGINSRVELAALALSRRYGAMSILAAAVLAALDDSPGHAAPESFTIKAANASAEVVIIKIGRKEIGAGGTPARAATKDRGAPAGKFVDPSVEITTSPFAQAALNESRPGSSSYSISMIAAFAALVYELDDASHAAQAFDFRDGRADLCAPFTASDVNGSAGALPGFANFGGTAVYDEAFAFKFAQGDTTAIDGSELHVGEAHMEDGGSGRAITISQGSGAVDAVAAAATGSSDSDPTHVGRDNGSNQARSQPDLRASDNSSEGAKEHDAPGDDLNRGQSQKVLRESDDGSGAKGHAKNEGPEDDSNHGQAQKAGNSSGTGHDKQEALGDGTDHRQSQKALHDADNGPAAAKGHATHEDAGHGQAHSDLQVEDGSAAGKQYAQHPQAGDSGSGKPQAFVNSAHDAHSAGKGGPSSDDADQAQPAAGTGVGDSFHFKKGIDDDASFDFLDTHMGEGSGNALGDGRHAAAHEALVPVQDVDAIDISAAQHDHSGHVNLHAAHDLIV
jgi:DNA-binding NarL/FixJ family response regulator